jgi:hypothetical protein
LFEQKNNKAKEGRTYNGDMKVLWLYSALSVTALAASVYTVIEFNAPFEGIKLPPLWKQLILHKLHFIVISSFHYHYYHSFIHCVVGCPSDDSIECNFGLK